MVDMENDTPTPGMPSDTSLVQMLFQGVYSEIQKLSSSDTYFSDVLISVFEPGTNYQNTMIPKFS